MSNITQQSRLPHWARVGFAMFSVGFGANLFAPMMQVYRSEHNSDEASLTAMLGIYAIGLIPSLLYFGASSDRYGRRPIMIPGLVLSAVASAILALGALNLSWPLFIGRIVIGVSVGMAMASGAAWVKQLSDDNPTAGPRRATVALSAGFGLGPLMSGIVAEFAPLPQLVPYLFHIALAAIAIVLVLPVPETQTPNNQRRSLVPRVVLSRRFFWTIAAWAPWVFGVPTTSFASTPSNVPVDAPWATAFLGLLAFVTMSSGVSIQPVATRLAARGNTVPLAAVGLSAAAVGLAVSIGVALSGWTWLMLVAAVVLGCSYGVMMVGGLIEAERIAPPEQLGGVIGIYYSLTYIGFLVPFAISLAVAALSKWSTLSAIESYVCVLGFGILVCLLSIRPVTKATQAH
ncbi:MFS transporter [Corynebacterium breve]|uniref:MFS transporter n=1 Tax=Corynebacterium breve TaxID=3049799 RepID=A0ABY8VDN2_9CORY|nr:MFS transporter [Corynebacterium breve]WIM67217.1 MFS transporter [Corynebacterium breve]